MLVRIGSIVGALWAAQALAADAVVPPPRPLGIDTETATWLMFLVICFVLIGIWSAASRIRADQVLRLGGPVARNLFLCVHFSRCDGSPGAKAADLGHIVEMNARMATFLSPLFLAKGDKVRLSLDKLPNFPAAAAGEGVEIKAVEVEASVTATRVMAGSPPTYMVTVRFAELAPTVRAPLVRYLEDLAGRGRLSHA